MMFKHTKAHFYFLAAMFFLNGAFDHAECQIPYTDLPQSLFAKGYQIEAWKLDMKNDLRLLLSFKDKDAIGLFHFAYAVVGPDGDFIEGPDSISEAVDFYPGTASFDTNGTVFIYSNTGHGYDGYLYRYSYNPRRHKAETKLYPDIDIGFNTCVECIPRIGNVLLLFGRNTQPYMSVIIDDYENSKMQIISFNYREGYIFPRVNTQIKLLDNGLFLVIGVDYSEDAAITGSQTEFPLALYKYILDFQHSEIVSYEKLTLYETIENKDEFLMLPAEYHGDLLKFKDQYIYVAPYKFAKTSSELAKHVFIEFDLEGNSIAKDHIPIIKVTARSFNDMPSNATLILHRAKPYKNSTFWILSCDDFPNLIIDKGITDH